MQGIENTAALLGRVAMSLLCDSWRLGQIACACGDAGDARQPSSADSWRCHWGQRSKPTFRFLKMIRPEPKCEPLPEPKRYEPPRGGRYRRRG